MIRFLNSSAVLRDEPGRTLNELRCVANGIEYFRVPPTLRSRYLEVLPRLARLLRPVGRVVAVDGATCLFSPALESGPIANVFLIGSKDGVDVSVSWLRYIHDAGLQALMGTGVFPEARGQGHYEPHRRAVYRWIFQNTAARRVLAYVYVNNPVSLKAHAVEIVDGKWVSHGRDALGQRLVSVERPWSVGYKVERGLFVLDKQDLTDGPCLNLRVADTREGEAAWRRVWSHKPEWFRPAYPERMWIAETDSGIVVNGEPIDVPAASVHVFKATMPHEVVFGAGLLVEIGPRHLTNLIDLQRINVPEAATDLWKRSIAGIHLHRAFGPEAPDRRPREGEECYAILAGDREIGILGLQWPAPTTAKYWFALLPEARKFRWWEAIRSEAFRMVFEERGALKAEAEVYTSNSASHLRNSETSPWIRVEGVQRGTIQVDGQCYDRVLFGCTRDEWIMKTHFGPGASPLNVDLFCS